MSLKLVSRGSRGAGETFGRCSAVRSGGSRHSRVSDIIYSYAATRYHRLNLFFISHDSISLEFTFCKVLTYSQRQNCALEASNTNSYYAASLFGSEVEFGGLLYNLSWIEGSVLLKEVSILDIQSSKTSVCLYLTRMSTEDCKHRASS